MRTTPKADADDLFFVLDDWQREHEEQRAEFCLKLGVTPDVYDCLTPAQIDVWAETAHRLNDHD